MKVKLIGVAIFLAGTASLSLQSLAAQTDASSTSDPAVKAAPAPHSHMQEKGYGAATKAAGAGKSKKEEAAGAAAGASSAVNPANDRSKHFHPRDR